MVCQQLHVPDRPGCPFGRNPQGCRARLQTSVCVVAEACEESCDGVRAVDRLNIARKDLQIQACVQNIVVVTGHVLSVADLLRRWVSTRNESALATPV